MTNRDLMIFLTLSFMWSLSFIFYRIGVPEFGSLAFASLRVVLAGLTMLVFVLLKKKNRQGIRDNWKVLTLVGLFSAAIPFMLFAFAARSVNAGVLAVLNASVPMMSGFIASTFFKDRLSKKQILGLVIGIVGVVILMSESLFGEQSATSGSGLLPMGYALLACVGYAVGANITRNYLDNVTPVAITAGSLIIASVIMLPIALYEFPYGKSISLTAWVSVICIGVFSTAIALIFMNQLIKSIGPMRATSITLVIPIFAIILGYLLLGEALDTPAIIGSVVILFGTYLSLEISIKKMLTS
ncbi:DMT family transporter [Psychrobacter namhaensis]|jgi:drug/metabolite transporter (DMT)-like permease|uniref:DMT family transporter n=1 Tax=Psychrobacter TaxID=497 RepID=UPI000EDB92DC|nr:MULTISPECIES: DMT family transporter [Psychrobacter]HCN17933.1 EamA family transporter [Psychrobacter sp.]|tara:strand:+ start:1690 stop:2586 length:897 start_codon:yes stop_codon:yes gene_type:complete